MYTQTILEDTYVFSYSDKGQFDTLYSEIFEKEIYDCDATSPLNIVDVGAHEGLSILYFNHKYPDAHIVAIEPNPESMRYLQHNINMNSIPDVQLHDCAISDSDTHTKFYVPSADQWSSNSSLSPRSWTGDVEGLVSVDIECRTLRD